MWLQFSFLVLISSIVALSMMGRGTIANETMASSNITNTMQEGSIENSTQFNLTQGEIENITDTDTNQTGSISGTISSREGPSSSNCTVC